MKVAIVKPDYGAAGGFEIVLQRIARGLRERGHQVDLAQVDATGSPTSHLPLPVSDDQVRLFREFFFHLNMIAKFEGLDLSAYDVALCTQPCSYAAAHPRKVLLFYHHTRAFYDLEHVQKTVRGHDNDLYQLAASIVRDVDSLYLTRGVRILAGSLRVKTRLAEYNGLFENVTVFTAGIDEDVFDAGGPVTFEQPLTIGRHEFPKRTELFLHAMHHLPGFEGRVLGVGSFTDRLVALDSWLGLQHVDYPGTGACAIDDDRLWRQYAIHVPMDELRDAAAALTARGRCSPTRFLGRASREDVIREYRSALCVVCPAFDEDFGLTCLEAMALGKPVIACRDGGGYVELIDDGVDGFLVEPSARAIASAIERLTDRDLARRMGARGKEKARAFSWPRAIDQIEKTLEEVRSQKLEVRS